jgi:glyceraldehyde-3-phosphate dehydrogenase (NADP+)
MPISSVPPSGTKAVTGTTATDAAAPAAKQSTNLKTPEVQPGGVSTGAASTATVQRTAQAISVRATLPYEDPAIAQLFPRKEDIPDEFRINPELQRPVSLIDGKVVEHAAFRPIFSKLATRTDAGLEPTLIGYEALPSATDIQSATKAAERAWGRGEGAWPTATAETRIKAVEAFATRMEAKADRIAKLLMYEIGKTYDKAKEEVTRSVATIRNAVKVYREIQADSAKVKTFTEGGAQHFFREEQFPLGVVMCVAPFNYPINEFLTVVVPALLSGNVVIGKTARFGVLANAVLAEDYAACFPAGTVAMLPGDGPAVIEPTMKAMELDENGKPVNALIDMLAFIGSERAAEAIIGYHPERIALHKVLGLGAKNPGVIVPGATEADLRKAAKELVKSGLGNNGQRCTAEKLFHVPEELGAQFEAMVVEEVEKLKLGMPFDSTNGITVLPEDNKMKWMRELIDDAVAKGAKIANKKGGTGFHSLMRPAVLTGVTNEMDITWKEQFGPIIAIRRYKKIDEVFAWQKTSPYKQQASVWGPDAETVKAARRLSMLGVPQVHVGMAAKRKDNLGFTASEKSGAGVLSDKDTLLTMSQKRVIVVGSEAALK